MALNKIQLKSSILDILQDMKTRQQDPDQAMNDFAEKLSNAIHDYVSNADIIATPANVAAAAMANSGGPVVAANNLQCNIL